jgi:hypothetical protein
MAEPEVVVPAALLGPVQLTVHSMNFHPQKNKNSCQKVAASVYFSQQNIVAAQHASAILKSSHEDSFVFMQWLSPPSLKGWIYRPRPQGLGLFSCPL